MMGESKEKAMVAGWRDGLALPYSYCHHVPKFSGGEADFPNEAPPTTT
jgi:hypothetical protein